MRCEIQMVKNRVFTKLILLILEQKRVHGRNKVKEDIFKKKKIQQK